MVLGAESAALTPSAFPPPAPPITGAVVGLVVPGAVLTFVKRERHPFIWTAFGLLPAIWGAGRLVLAVGSKVEKR